MTPKPGPDFMLTSPSWCRIRALFATLTVVLVAAACNDDEVEITGVTGGSSPAFVDVGHADADPDSVDRVFKAYCSPGERRCLFENSPIYQECAPGGERFDIGACSAGQMCREGRCVDFACRPGRDICIGTKTRATCAEDGRSHLDEQSCDGESDICRNGECVDACAAAARERSYIGCEYLARELPNLYRVGGETDADAPFAVVVANPSPLLDTTVTITTPAGEPAPLLESVTITPQAHQESDATTVRSEVLTDDDAFPIESPAREVTLPPRAAGVFLLDPGAPIKMRAYRVESTRPIIAYQFSPYCCNVTASNDASLLLPVAVLDERYRVLSYPTMLGMAANDHYRSTMTIVAHEDDTRVDVDSPVQLQSSRDSFPRDAFPGGPLTLDAGESISLGAATTRDENGSHNLDISGAVVSADKKIAVFAGHECTFVPQDEWACDHLQEQMFPASTLGKRFLLTPMRRRGQESATTEAVYWRLLADESTTITFSEALDDLDVKPPSNDFTDDCAQMADGARLDLDAGQYCEFGTLDALGLHSTGALIVGGVLAGHHSTGRDRYGSHAGDPSFFLLPAVEQFRTSYSFVSPPTFEKNYVAVAAPRAAAVALDGVSIEPEQRIQLAQTTLEGARWDLYIVAVEAGYHTMEASERFAIVPHAYDDYVSYAFPGGLDLTKGGP